MEIDDIKELCEVNGMPTEGWKTHSIPENPVQIYDREGFKAILNRDCGRIRIYDLSKSRIRPVIDTGEDDWVQKIISGGAAIV